MATIAVLDTELRAKTDKFDAPIKESTKLLDVFKSGIVATGAASVAAFATINKSMEDFRAFGDDIDKMSKRLGIGTDDIQSMAFAFEQNGGSAMDMERAIRTLNKAIVQMETEGVNGRLTTYFDELGVSFADLQPLGMADRFRAVALSLKEIDDVSRRRGIAEAIFGRGAGTIQPLLDNLGELEQQFKDLNLGASQEQIKIAADLTDQWNIMRLSLLKVGAAFSEAFGPSTLSLLKSAAEFVNEIATGITSFTDFVEGMNVRQRTGAELTARQFSGLGNPTDGLADSNIGNQLFGVVDEMVKAFTETQDIEAKQLDEMKKIRTLEEKTIPALQKDRFETIRFLDKRTERREEKVVGLLEENNNWLENLVRVIENSTGLQIPVFDAEVIR